MCGLARGGEVGKIDGERLHGAQAWGKMVDRLDRHDDKLGGDQEDVLAVRVSQLKAMQQVEEKDL